MASVDVAVYGLGWVSGWLLLCRPFGRPAPENLVTTHRRSVGGSVAAGQASVGGGSVGGAAGQASVGGGSVAVIIPARNEATSIGAALDALVGGGGRRQDEVVVVDDASTDATVAVASNCGARVISAGPLPTGWTGKNHACAVGVDATTAPILVFVDADVRLDPVSLGALCPDDDTLVSMQPWHDAARGRERLSVIPSVLAIMGAGTWSIAGPRVQANVAFGPVLAMTRVGYERVGGHDGVRGATLEDVAFAQRYRRVELHTGRAWASFRMHPDGYRQQLDGWTRLMGPGLMTTRPAVMVACVAWVASLVGGAAASPWCYAMSALQVWVLGRRVGRFGPLTAALYPFSIVLLLVVMLRGFRRRVTWRGRTVPASRTHARGNTAAH